MLLLFRPGKQVRSLYCYRQGSDE